MTLRTTSPNQRATYVILSIIIAGLIILIGWFTYLLVKPSDSTTTINQTTTNNSNKNKNSNKATNKNTVNSNAANTNNAKANGNVNNANSNTAGLVEPDANANTNTANTNANEDNADGTKAITLYFPKDTASCGVVYAVKRNVTPTDDFYGQVILEDMHGPSDTDTGYTTAVPSSLHLREVRYTSAGPVITVNDAFDALSTCDQKTVTAQLVKTANAMFDLPESTTGEVVVGTTSNTNTSNTNDNTNTTE